MCGLYLGLDCSSIRSYPLLRPNAVFGEKKSKGKKQNGERWERGLKKVIKAQSSLPLVCVSHNSLSPSKKKKIQLSDFR